MILENVHDAREREKKKNQTERSHRDGRVNGHGEWMVNESMQEERRLELSIAQARNTEV